MILFKNMTPDFKKKLNLYEVDDVDYEEFRDVLTDNATLNGKLIPVGESNSFGNLCSLEAISHSEINDYDKDNKFLLTLLDMHDIKLEDAKLIHCKYYLHTQAEDHIKIDIVWETSRAQDVSDYNILGVYLECKGKQMDGNSAVYDPYESGYWDEWLVDFGIKEDTHPQD